MGWRRAMTLGSRVASALPQTRRMTCVSENLSLAPCASGYLSFYGLLLCFQLVSRIYCDHKSTKATRETFALLVSQRHFRIKPTHNKSNATSIDCWRKKKATLLQSAIIQGADSRAHTSLRHGVNFPSRSVLRAWLRQHLPPA